MRADRERIGVVVSGSNDNSHIPASISMEHESSLRHALSDDGDLELRFQCGKSIPVHSQKLKLVSPLLKGVISAALDDLIASATAERRRALEGSLSSVADHQQ